MVFNFVWLMFLNKSYNNFATRVSTILSYVSKRNTRVDGAGEINSFAQSQYREMVCMSRKLN